MSAERRRELVDLARRYDFLILEDVAYRELGFGPAGERPAGERRRPAAEHVVAGARRGAAGGHVLQDLLARIPDGLGGRAGRGRRQARHRQAELRPVRGRARPADARGVRPGRSHGPSDRRVPGAVRAASAPDDGGAGRPHARRRHLDDAGRGILRLAHLPGRASTRSRCRPPPAPRRSPTCPDGRSTWPTRESAANQIRLAYSRVADDLIDEGIRRIADVVKSAL